MTNRFRRRAGIAVLTTVLAATGGANAWAQAPATERVSVNSDEQQANSHAFTLGSNLSDAPQAEISDDGRYVAWWSDASNLVPRDSNRKADVFVRDRQAGTTARVSVGARGRQANGDSVAVAMSADGRYVAFVSHATNLVPGDTNGAADVFVRDRVQRTTTRVSVDGGRQADTGVMASVEISADGNVVVYESYSRNLGPQPDRNLDPDVFAHDRRSAVTTHVSAAPGGATANGTSRLGSMSDDGRLIAFTSTASNLVAGDTNATADAFLHDLQTGVTTRIAEKTAEGFGEGGVQLSGDGRVVAVQRAIDAYVIDRATGEETVFEPWDRVPPAPWTALGALSADGSRVLFQSNASDLVPGDVPGTLDVFVRDRKTGADQRLSVTPAGAGANGRSSMAGMSRDGRWAAFRSDASDLVAGDTNRRTDLFVRGPLPTS